MHYVLTYTDRGFYCLANTTIYSNREDAVKDAENLGVTVTPISMKQMYTKEEVRAVLTHAIGELEHTISHLT